MVERKFRSFSAMSKKPKILCFAGSLRNASFNKKLVKIAMAGAIEGGAEATYLDLKEFPLPIYDEDLENQEIPENVHKLKALFWEHDGFLIASPEYNSSISGVLKNTIDWVSRQTQEKESPLSCFKGKTACLMSASPGGLGGLRGLVTLRSILSNIQVMLLPDQMAISKAHEAFDANGELKDEKQQAQILSLGKTLTEFTQKITS